MSAFVFAVLFAPAEIRLRVCPCLPARLFPHLRPKLPPSLVLLWCYLSAVLKQRNDACSCMRALDLCFFLCLFKVEKLLKAVDIDKIGTHAVGAKDRVIAASKTTLADINDSATK